VNLSHRQGRIGHLCGQCAVRSELERVSGNGRDGLAGCRFENRAAKFERIGARNIGCHRQPPPIWRELDLNTPERFVAPENGAFLSGRWIPELDLPSRLEEASSDPLGKKLTLVTRCECPRSVLSRSPFRGSRGGVGPSMSNRLLFEHLNSIQSEPAEL